MCSLTYYCEHVLWSFIDFLYVITSQHNHIKGRKYTEYLLIYRILPPAPLFWLTPEGDHYYTQYSPNISLMCVRGLSCHAIEFQGWTRCEKLFQLVPARSGLWTRSSCKVSILWRIPQYSPKKLNLNKSVSIHIFVGSVSIHSVWGVEKYSTSAWPPVGKVIKAISNVINNKRDLYLPRMSLDCSIYRWPDHYSPWFLAIYYNPPFVFYLPSSNSTHFWMIWCPDKNPNVWNETHVLIFKQNESCPNC